MTPCCPDFASLTRKVNFVPALQKKPACGKDTVVPAVTRPLPHSDEVSRVGEPGEFQ